MDTNAPTPFPVIHVDLNHEPCEFFFPDYSDQYPSSRYTLLPQPHPHQGSHHPDHAKSVEHLITARGGGPDDHPLNKDLVNGKNSIYGHDDDHGRPQEYFPVKWMSSKTRITKKMTGGAKPSAMNDLGLDPNHKASSGIPLGSMDVLEKDTSCSANSNKNSGSWIESNNNNSKPAIIRVCTDCNTTKTPLWRSGPTGPKSLCNACGIRQRKARRAMAAAAVATNGKSPPQPNPAQMKVQQKKKKKMKNPSDNHPQPMKKPKTLDPPVGSRNPCFEEFLMKLSEWISDFRGVFPQDEKEAAILLMALSHGLVQADNLS